MELTEKFTFLEERASVDCPAFNCPLDEILNVLTYARDELSYGMMVDVTAIDWAEGASPRFEVVYHLLNLENHNYLRLVIPCADDENPTAPTVSHLFPAADWHERETYDMFGIIFENHPDLRRILMWDAYPYFPLRKEFPLAGIETEFPAADVHEATNARVQAAPMMGGPFTAGQSSDVSKNEPKAKDESWTEASEKPFDS